MTYALPVRKSQTHQLLAEIAKNADLTNDAKRARAAEILAQVALALPFGLSQRFRRLLCQKTALSYSTCIDAYSDLEFDGVKVKSVIGFGPSVTGQVNSITVSSSGSSGSIGLTTSKTHIKDPDLFISIFDKKAEEFKFFYLTKWIVYPNHNISM